MKSFSKKRHREFSPISSRERKRISLNSKSTVTSDCLQNRSRESNSFPEVIESIVDLNVKGAIIDAEIVALHEKGRASFHLLGAYDINQQRPPIFLYAFDLLQLNGEDLKSFPWSSGKRALQKRVSKPPGVSSEVALGSNSNCSRNRNL